MHVLVVVRATGSQPIVCCRAPRRHASVHRKPTAALAIVDVHDPT